MNSGSPGEFDDRVVRILTALKTSPERDPQKAQAGRQAFLAEAGRLQSARPASARSSRPNARTPLTGFFRPGVRLFRPIAALIIITVLILGTGVTTAAARGSLPGSPLYPVKLFREDLQLALETDPQKDYQLRSEFIDERVEEIKSVLAGGEIPPPEVEARLQAQIEESLAAALNLPPEQAELALTQMKERLERHTQALLQLQDHGSDKAFDTVLRTRVMMLAKMKLVEEKLTGSSKDKKQPGPAEVSETPAPKNDGIGKPTPEPDSTETPGNGNNGGKKTLEPQAAGTVVPGQPTKPAPEAKPTKPANPNKPENPPPANGNDPKPDKDNNGGGNDGAEDDGEDKDKEKDEKK